MTKMWVADEAGRLAERDLQEAAGLLAAGELVAFPTETVYGLGADAGNTAAVEGIYRAKGRPSDNPLIVHISDMEMLDRIVLRVDETSRRLAEAFWPGPLTLVLPVRPGAVSPRVTAGLDTVAVRMPDHPVALALIAAAGCPVAAPSANRSGRPSPTLASHVREDLEGRIAGIVDAGGTGVGLESTVAEAGADGRVHVLRPGGVTPAQLAAAAGCEVRVAADAHGGAELAPAAVAAGEAAFASAGDANDAVPPADRVGAAPLTPAAEAARLAPTGAAEAAPPLAAGINEVSPPDHAAGAMSASGASAAAGAVPHAPTGAADAAFRPKSPGMKYTHYAPQGRLTIVTGPTPEAVHTRIARELDAARAVGERTGVLVPEEHAPLYHGRADVVAVCGSLRDPASTARALFGALRRFDEAGATRLYAEAFSEEGIGLAVMNRLRKAAGYHIIEA